MQLGHHLRLCLPICLFVSCECTHSCNASLIVLPLSVLSLSLTLSPSVVVLGAVVSPSTCPPLACQSLPRCVCPSSGCLFPCLFVPHLSGCPRRSFVSVSVSLSSPLSVRPHVGAYVLAAAPHQLGHSNALAMFRLMTARDPGDPRHPNDHPLLPAAPPALTCYPASPRCPSPRPPSPAAHPAIATPAASTSTHN